jgi:hypothetical protein
MGALWEKLMFEACSLLRASGSFSATRRPLAHEQNARLSTLARPSIDHTSGISAITWIHTIALMAGAAARPPWP